MCQRSSFVPDCDCSECLPDGCDGAMEDQIDAALAAATKRAPRGAYQVRMTAGAIAVEWHAEDGAPPTRIEREALHEAAHALRRCGRHAELAPGARAVYLAA